MTTDAEFFALIAGERRRAADMIETLDDAQLETASLCSAWTVRDVAGHLISPFATSIFSFLVGSLTSGGMGRYNAKLARELGRRPVDEIADTLRKNAEHRFTPPGTGPHAPLSDLAVHVRDMARPLGLPVTAAPQAWAEVLGFLTSARARAGFVPRGRLHGLRLEATDLDFVRGDGAVVSGPGEALAMVAAGRAVALGDLSGDGVSVLAGRLRA